MTRQSIAFWCALASVICAAPAAAADLPPAPVYKAPPAVAGYDWSGFYAGVNFGYGWHDPKNTIGGDVDDGAGAGVVNALFNVDSITNAVYPVNGRTSGALGGLQAGFNWQSASRWLVGIETDLQLSGVRGGSSIADPPPGLVLFALSTNRRLDWFGTLRGRFGVAVADQLLLYGTGGLAYGETKESASVAEVGSIGITFPVGFATTLTCAAASVCFAGSQSQVSAGWTAGGGAEYAVSRSVTLKAEYLHVDLGSRNLTLAVQAPNTGTAFTVAHFDNAFDLVRGGVNVRF